MSGLGGHVPERIRTQPRRWHICDGHLEPDPKAPACPRCLVERLASQQLAAWYGDPPDKARSHE